MTPLQKLEAAMHKAIQEYMDAFRHDELAELEHMITGLEDEVQGVTDYKDELKSWIADRRS